MVVQMKERLPPKRPFLLDSKLQSLFRRLINAPGSRHETRGYFFEVLTICNFSDANAADQVTARSLPVFLMTQNPPHGASP